MVKNIFKLITTLIIYVCWFSYLENIESTIIEVLALALSLYTVVVVLLEISMIYSLSKWKSKFKLSIKETRELIKNEYEINSQIDKENDLIRQNYKKDHDRNNTGITGLRIASTAVSFAVQKVAHLVLPGLGFVLHPIFKWVSNEIEVSPYLKQRYKDHRITDEMEVTISELDEREGTLNKFLFAFFWFQLVILFFVVFHFAFHRDPYAVVY